MCALHAPAYRWTVENYEKLPAADLFVRGERVELLNGAIIPLARPSYRDSVAVARLSKFFVLQLNDRSAVSPRNPFVLDPYSEVHPDLCLLHPACERVGRLPRPDEVFLAIEVSDSTLRYDREDKRPAYARGGVREYWIVNLADNILEVYRDPAGETYRDAQTLGADAKIAPLAFPDVELRVRDFLP
jgi:Uma2 family endonuclease